MNRPLIWMIISLYWDALNEIFDKLTTETLLFPPFFYTSIWITTWSMFTQFIVFEVCIWNLTRKMTWSSFFFSTKPIDVTRFFLSRNVESSIVYEIYIFRIRSIQIRLGRLTKKQIKQIANGLSHCKPNKPHRTTTNVEVKSLCQKYFNKLTLLNSKPNRIDISRKIALNGKIEHLNITNLKKKQSGMDNPKNSVWTKSMQKDSFSSFFLVFVHFVLPTFKSTALCFQMECIQFVYRFVC